MAFSPLSIFFLLSMLLVFASALDMSIISKNQKKNVNEPAGRTEDEVKDLYESWLVKYGKNYNGIGEKERRFQVFKDNLRFIDQQNSENRSYKLGLNRFADLTNQEYRSMYLGTRLNTNRHRSNRSKSSRYAYRLEGDNLPKSIDWRQKGAVVPVKDQGSCGKLLLSSNANWNSKISYIF